MIDISEKNFEDDIARALLEAGYEGGAGASYDRELCLIPDDVVTFVQAAQPKAWKKFHAMHGDDARGRFLDRLADEIGRRGTLDVLRKGVKCDGCRFRLVQFKPSSGLNEEIIRLYRANVFRVVRQLRYGGKGGGTLDLAIFVNGLPVFTAELKNPFTGQNVEHAVRQYRLERDPREPLFAFGRCLAHFAVDPDSVYFATQLRGEKTRFFPFNRGRNGGAGNPPSALDYATSYLWREVWAKDSVLGLLQHFIHVVEEEDDRGRKTGERSLIFPRCHQLECVRGLVRDAREKGPGRSYLIQHSAGSGKSYSISWLAHQLSVLHDDDDRRVFDSIIVITDRRVLDRQLQRHAKNFEQVAGVVENIDKKSKQLGEALKEGKTIVVTTLQKFPYIVDDVGRLPGQRFAIIVDEAHSSQTGESARTVKEVLAVEGLEEAEREDVETGDDVEDRVVAVARSRGPLANASYFAFTATPKPRTMELFGEKQEDGTYVPFSLYSMRQAIEEGFILDVLENYTTYKTYWNLLKKVAGDPKYERGKANYLLKSFVDLHEHSINKKVAIIIEHFAGHVMHRIGGRAKAMIITRSRLHAVRYKVAVDRYLKERGHNFKALVAFSGTVKDGGLGFTEAGMNGFPDTQTADAFKRDENRILVAAFKFQTGFDQPLLHTMYVDQKLGGVRAVQTLSRLNRNLPNKDETMVLDFANEAEDVTEAFKPYYDRTLLTEGTDPNLLYDRQTKMESYHLYGDDDVDRFAREYFVPKPNEAKLYSALAPVIDRYVDAAEEDQKEFRGALSDFVRLYGFLSHVLPFADADLEKLYAFGRLLWRRLPVSVERLPREIQEQIDLESLRVQKTGEGKITPARGRGELEPMKPKDKGPITPDEIETLSAIIKELNERFGTDFSEEDKVFIEQLEERLNGDDALFLSVRANVPENARLTFDHVANDKLQDMVDTNYKLYKLVNDDKDFARVLFDWLFERYLKRAGRQEQDDDDNKQGI
ncbi:MAG: type I restriction endonuclease [Candidatus Zixiibacteriota bacterium]|jgi:type I restriction enzyme R subunit